MDNKQLGRSLLSWIAIVRMCVCYQEQPAMDTDEKNKMLREAQAYLNSQMYKAAKDVGYEHMTTPNPRYV